MTRALEKLRAGSGNKGSLWSGQERVCCYLPKALKLGLKEPQPSGREERETHVSSAEPTQASRRHYSPDNQLIQHLMVQKGKLTGTPGLSRIGGSLPLRS